MVEAEKLFRPEVDLNLCINCGACVKLCPWKDPARFDRQGKDTVDGVFDQDIGRYAAIYEGHSCDEALRLEASSGGMVTGILKSLFERQEITGAVVVRMSYGETLRAEAFIARSVEDVLSSRGSKYCPTHLGSVLGALKKEPGKFAVVCLPCQAEALRRLMNVSKVFEEKIAWVISLFCGQCPSYQATEDWLKEKCITGKDLRSFTYRAQGRPGRARVVSNKGQDVCDPWEAVWGFIGSGSYNPPYCLQCRDLFGEAADISAGDAWLEKNRGDKKGSSVVIARTRCAKDLLEAGVSVGDWDLRKVDPDELKESCAANLTVKKDLALIIAGKSKASLVQKIAGFLYQGTRKIKSRGGLSGKSRWFFRKIFDRGQALLFRMVMRRKYRGYF
jgi:coenzyme F420 hydrogenase subunit beta